MYTVQQGAAGCVTSLSPASARVWNTGGGGRIDVVTGADCSWTAVSSAPWLTITSGAGGSGNGSVYYSVAKGPGPRRTGTIAVADGSFTVEQRGPFHDAAAPLAGVSAMAAVAWGDYDNDGRLDLLIAGSTASGPSTTLYHNEGAGGLRAVTTALAPLVSSFGHQPAVAWGDYDGDGDLDLFLCGSDATGPVSRLYRNTGGGFTVAGVPLLAVEGCAAAWGDSDGDGDLDLLYAGLGSAGRATKLYRNDGSGGFSDVQAGLPGRANGSVAWGDYDNDGDLDVLLTGDREAGSTPFLSEVYRNDGGGRFAAIEAGLPGLGWRSTGAWGDFDNDGDLDILLTGYPFTAKVFVNSGGRFYETRIALPAACLRHGGLGRLRWGRTTGHPALGLELDGRGQEALVRDLPERTRRVHGHRRDGSPGGRGHPRLGRLRRRRAPGPGGNGQPARRGIGVSRDLPQRHADGELAAERARHAERHGGRGTGVAELDRRHRRRDAGGRADLQRARGKEPQLLGRDALDVAGRRPAAPPGAGKRAARNDGGAAIAAARELSLERAGRRLFVRRLELHLRGQLHRVGGHHGLHAGLRPGRHGRHPGRDGLPRRHRRRLPRHRRDLHRGLGDLDLDQSPARGDERPDQRTTPSGTATSADSFAIACPAPTVTSFSPTSGGVGTAVAITGTHFPGATQVQFNGTSAAAYTVDSATRIMATVPNGATSGAIKVTTPSGMATSVLRFTVIPAPSIGGFYPASGPVGTSVRVSGSGFEFATRVQVGGTGAIAYSVDSKYQITVAVPVGAATGPIRVTAPGGTATSTGVEGGP